MCRVSCVIYVYYVYYTGAEWPTEVSGQLLVALYLKSENIVVTRRENIVVPSGSMAKHETQP